MTEVLQDTTTREPPLPPDAKTFSGDEQGLKQAVAWKRQQREQQGESPIVDLHSTPILARTLDEETNKDLETFSATKALRTASKVISDQKKLEAWREHGIEATLPQINEIEDYARENAPEGFAVHHPRKGIEQKVGLAFPDY